MAKNRNCPNCGAPYDIEFNKCPYCGTSYFDLTAIDINDETPFYLKIRFGNMILTELVRVKDCALKMESNVMYCENGVGTKVASFSTGNDFYTDLSFEAVVPYNKKEVYTITTV